MYFNRFDVCEAYYMFSMLFHGGMGCSIYAKFGQLERLRFRPSPLLSNPCDLDENAREIYRQLVVSHCGINSTAPTQR